MGIFSFIKDAGKKIFGIDKPSSTEVGTMDETKENEKAARKLEETIADLNLKAENLKIHIENH